MKRLLITVLILATVAFAQTATNKSGTKKSATKKAATTAPTAGPVAVFDTTAGTMRCTLFPKQAPKTVDNFIGLAEGTKQWKDPLHGNPMTRPLYNGTIFHRVIPNFMVQGGDPLGNGEGGPGYSFADEISPTLKFDRPGRLAMANSGPNTNGSQFFITEVPTPWLNGHHTIFGQCDDATVAMVKKMARAARDPSNDRPFDPVKINKITIEQGKTPRFLGPPVKKPGPAKK
jgi:peptidyl-prolyl cis-trans isomerase A (cyclophilin A)